MPFPRQLKWALPLMAGSMWLLVATQLVAADERRERMAYTTRRPAALDLYLSRAEGSMMQMTDGAGVLDDMSLVASHVDGSEKREIFRPPTSTPVWATSWARHADLIAFTVGPIFAPDEAVVDIWTVRGDGSHATNLTQGKFRNNSFPDLTPDGRQIVFRSTRDGGKNIYVMNSDGTHVRRITQTVATATMPTISPNGDMIAYSGGGFRLYLQRLKHGEPDGPPTLFQEYHPSVHPRFSPDGKWLVFASRRAWLNDEAPLSHGNSQPYGEIFVAPVDGSAAPIRLTHNRWEDSVPCWGVMPRP
jgi:Tol biopolymer transport system component